MSSGLIWGALGKSLADTGSMIGSMYARQGEQEALAAREDARSRALAEREDQRSANALKSQEAMVDYREQKAKAADEALQQRVIKETAAAEARAQQMPNEREVAQISKYGSQVAGESPAATPEQIKELVDKNPQYRKVYEDAGLIQKENPRLQAASDTVTAAMEAGAHSSTLKGLQDQRTAVLKEISEENKVKKQEAFEASTNARLDILAQNANSTARMAGAAETRAGKDSSSNENRETTKDLERKVKSARDSLAEKLGVNENNVNEEVERLKKRAETDPVFKAKFESVQKDRDAVQTARDRLNAWEAKGPGTAAPAPDASIQSKVEAQGVKYEPTKFNYRITADGSIQRKAK
jgi:hypothetical protein